VRIFFAQLRATFQPPFALLAVCVLLFSGCASIETRKVVDLSQFKKIYVEHRLTDDRRVDEMIVQELTKLGYQASRGPLTMLPDHTDAVLTYEDRWEWDFKTYLIEFNVTVRTARTNKKLADGRYYQPTPNSKAPAEVVSKVITPLFGKK
jgi:lysyl-tRNA synthetase class I